MIKSTKEIAKKKQKETVSEMFNHIAYKYDFLNHFLSIGIDKLWRKKVVKILCSESPKTILDIATGTGDLAIAAMKSNPEKIIGIDISSGMVEVGKLKIKNLSLDSTISLIIGDSENLPFNDNMFSAATVGFGVRNFEHLEIGLSEIFRVLEPGGVFIVLEFSKPKIFPIKQLYHFYFRFILPATGKLISGNSMAYKYLFETAMAFPNGKDFLTILEKTGFKNYSCIPQTFGIASIYCAYKPKI